MKFSKIVILGVVVVFIATLTIFYVIDNLSKTMKRCEKDKTLKFCQTNTIAIAVIMLLMIVAGLVIVIMTVGYIMISASGGVRAV
jgi:uncharacterized BrkB/YihY/UPF0761 family membrane protein